MKYSRLVRPSLIALCCALVLVLGTLPTTRAQAAVQNPQSGSIGVEGTIPTAPPSKAPTITTPRNGQTFTGIPITVAGLCTSGLLIKIFANNIFVGSAQCINGSYSLQVDLFGGRNDLVARAFDALDQPSPDSNIVTVTFDDSQFNKGSNGSLLLLTSSYAKRGANPGDVLTWPVILSGGSGPYALSIDWGDGKPTDLKVVQLTGTIDLSHVYDSAGVYVITIRATDKNGLIAFLQVVGVANGAITSNALGKNNTPTTKIITKVLWLPAALIMLLLPAAFWLGRRYELASLRKHLQRHR
jgi:hypothetical protein